jgi:hypothetical protein
VVALIGCFPHTENMRLGALFMAIFLFGLFIAFFCVLPYLSKWLYQLRCKIDAVWYKRFPAPPPEIRPTEIRNLGPSPAVAAVS